MSSGQRVQHACRQVLASEARRAVDARWGGFLSTSRGRLRRWPVVVTGWLAVACMRASPPVPATDAAQSPAHPDLHITLERGPCFGTCPVYAVALEGSGAVLFQGRRFVADTGVSTATIPAARVDSLAAELAARGYFDFADRYRAGEPGCERYATDLPTVITEVRAAGRVKRVEHDHGCMEAPAALTELEARIDSVAGVSRWIRR